MRRDRFENILRYLHFNDNYLINNDRFYKVRSLLEYFNKKAKILFKNRTKAWAEWTLLTSDSIITEPLFDPGNGIILFSRGSAMLCSWTLGDFIRTYVLNTFLYWIYQRIVVNALLGEIGEQSSRMRWPCILSTFISETSFDEKNHWPKSSISSGKCDVCNQGKNRFTIWKMWSSTAPKML